MKKLINRPEDVLADALKGIDAAHPELRVDHQHRVIYRARPKPDGKHAGHDHSLELDPGHHRATRRRSR